jgi:hypothetical protein
LNAKESIKSQYWASLEMLRQAILQCPDSLWQSAEYQNPFWHVAYHAIFYTHLYLHATEADFAPWEKHKPEARSLKASSEGKESAYSKEEVLEYLDFCLEQMESLVDALNLEGQSGFYWLPFDKLELQFYNIRHIQQHTGELCERLGAKGEVQVDWVGMKEWLVTS